MKRIRFVVAITAIVLMIAADLTTYAEYEERPYLKKARCTAYVLKGTMASGKETRDGVCAFTEEALGKTMIIYLRHEDGSVGSLVGIYECLDVCPTEHVIDIWAEDMDAAQEIMNKVYEEDAKGRVYYEILDAKG